MFNFDFYKMHGTGNDFIVVDNRNNHSVNWTPEVVSGICNRRLGIGADGLLLLESSQKATFKMRYFNSDGPEAEMCGNGSRCISWFAYEKLSPGKQFSFEAMDGIHYAEITGPERVKVQILKSKLNDSRTFPESFTLPQKASFLNFINTGVPHLILNWPSVTTEEVATTGRQLRFHSYYQPQGTNVNFCEVTNSQGKPVLNVRTFERGVDEETLSCGSGVTASALTFLEHELIKGPEINIHSLGGDLTIYAGQGSDEVYLEGPIQIVYRGSYQL